MKKFALFLIVFLFTAFTGSFAARYYVAWLASGADDGSSWDDAFNSMNTAINSTSTGDTIFVASGLYPCSTGSRDESINLKQGVVILGCFAGDEDPIDQSVIDNRDFENNGTMLFGDLLLDDDFGGSNEENSYHVVVAKGTMANPIDSTTVLDGFFIYGGNANGDTDTNSVGGGVYLSATGGGICNPTLKRLIIFGNYAKEGGGMMLYAGTNSECSPALDSILFRINHADGGAGLFCKASGGICKPELYIVDFNYNTLSGDYPGKGAAIFNYAENTASIAECSPTIKISEISHHEGDVDGGAVYNLAGGINEGICNPAFINMSFYKNGSYGIYNEIKKGTCTPQLTNVILWNESMNNKGGALPDIDHCIIEGSGGSGGGWDIYLGNDGGSNLDADPLWADPDGRNFRLLAGSPALSAGNAAEGINIGSYQGTAVGEPAKIIIIGSLNHFGHLELGYSSAEQYFDIKGTNLSADIEIDAPEGFAITTISGDYSGDTTEIILSESGDTVALTRIYVRFSPTIAKAYSSVIANTSDGAADKFLVVEGNCYEDPTISVTGILESYDSVMVDDYSGEQNFTVEGFALISHIAVTSPEGFEISLTSGDYSGNTDSIALIPVDSAILPTVIYVRFAPDEDKYYADNIVLLSSGAENKNVFVQGIGYATSNITLTGTLSDFGSLKRGEYSSEQNFDVEGSALTSDLLITAPEGFQITLTSGDYSGKTDSIWLVPAVGTVSSTPVYIRFAPSQVKVYSGDVIANSPRAEAESLSATGECIAEPVITITGILSDFGLVLANQFSAEQSFDVKGSDLLGNITVESPDGFQMTLASGDYSGDVDSLTLVMVSDSVGLTTVYLRFAPTEQKPYMDSIKITTYDAMAEFLVVTGNGVTAPELSAILDTTACEGEVINNIQIDITDNDVNTVVLEALSNNTQLLPVSGINISGTGGSRTIDLEPSEGETGSTDITIIATNSQAIKDSTEFTLTVNENPTITDISVTDEHYGNDGEITITASSPAGGLLYALDLGVYQASPTFTGLSQGLYGITVMDAYGCKSDDNAQVDKISGLHEISEIGLRIYPVPSDGILHIKNLDKLDKPYIIKIYSNIGELIYITKYSNINEINLKGYSKGFYVLKLFIGNKVYIEKFSIK